MEDSEYGYLAAPAGTSLMNPTTQQHQEDPLLQSQGLVDSSEANKPLLRKGSLRSALVRDGKYSRQSSSSRVRFAEPLVESYFSVPCSDMTPRMVRIVSGEDGSPWGDMMSGDSETDIELEIPMSGRFINPVYGGGRGVFLVTDEGARHDSAVLDRGYYGYKYHWGMGGSTAISSKEHETELLCGVGLAWILFGFGFLLFPMWYIGMFSTCITRDKRDLLGAIGCGVGAMVATVILILVLIDGQAGHVQPFLDPPGFRLL